MSYNIKRSSALSVDNKVSDQNASHCGNCHSRKVAFEDGRL